MNQAFCRLLWVALFLTLGAGASAQAPSRDIDSQPVVKLGEYPGAVPIADKMQILTDAGGLMSHEDVVQVEMQPVSGDSLGIGYSDSVVWLRLRLERPDQALDNHWRLEVDNVQVNDAQFYLRSADGQWQMQRAGRNYLHQSWPLKTRVPVFTLELAPGKYEVLLRLSSDHTLSGAIRLWSVSNFADHAIAESLGFGAYFGSFVCALLLQVFYLFMGRERRFGWYVFYTVVIFIGAFFHTGYIQNYLDLGGSSSNAFLGTFICLVSAVLVRVSVIWMALDQKHPVFAWIFQGTVYLVCATTSLLVLSGHYTLGVQVNQAGALVWTLMSVCIAVYVIVIEKDERGWSYLAVFSFVDIGIFVRFARNLGLLASTSLSDYALFIGMGLHLIAMSAYFMYRYSTLREALSIEQRAREEQREFVSMVSHEFRTPLAIISTSAQQLASNTTAPMERIQQRAINIRNATTRLNRLLDEYLSLDRLDSTEQAVVLQPGDFYSVIEDATADWELDKIHVQIHELPTPFVCDHSLMRIVLRNLLANGIRHSPVGTSVELRVTGTAQGGVHIEVEDHGSGLGPDELPKVFEKYFRGRAAQGQPGAGLGLYLVKRIVEQHGGTISAASALEKGTVFVIDLPG